jgi:uncharacterized protein YegL
MMQELICILDKSCSMQAVANDAVHGFNSFLKIQQELGEANLTVVMFDDQFEVAYEGKLSQGKPLKQWPNGGMTALYDAIGKTINHVRERFSREQPEKVIVAIMTDGEENSSSQFNKDQIASELKEHQDKYAWDVIYLAANQDAWAVAESLNIAADNAFDFDTENTIAAFDLYSNAVTHCRKR